ncbi:MAG TPA: prepilin-type N-terminal cleavage/methylation domain-containing protein [Desulfobaccales bacterium]|nr:prepilin-type N-terminal cleavage/methylation domain-containing protein [Desulfobaccales bacterium]
MTRTGISPASPLQSAPLKLLRPSGAEGFSLLEVLVATAIMGLVLVVLLQVLTSALRAQNASWGHTQALLTGEKILEENCQINSLAAGTYQGRDGRFDYVVQITPQYELSNFLGNKRVLCSLIQVTVRWEEQGRRKSLELQTVRTRAQEGL